MDRPMAPRFENCCYFKSGRLAPNLADSGTPLARVCGKPHMRPFLTPWRLFPSDGAFGNHPHGRKNVSALSEARLREKVEVGRVFGGAFDKAVRT
jgi:hypothetical protein